jgi:hypothetical protein
MAIDIKSYRIFFENLNDLSIDLDFDKRGLIYFDDLIAFAKWLHKNHKPLLEETGSYWLDDLIPNLEKFGQYYLEVTGNTLLYSNKEHSIPPIHEPVSQMLLELTENLKSVKVIVDNTNPKLDQIINIVSQGLLTKKDATIVLEEKLNNLFNQKGQNKEKNKSKSDAELKLEIITDFIKRESKDTKS